MQLICEVLAYNCANSPDKMLFPNLLTLKYFLFLPKYILNNILPEMLPRNIMKSFRNEKVCQHNFHKCSPPYKYDLSLLAAPRALPCRIFSKKLWTSFISLLFIFMLCTWSLAADGDFTVFDAAQIQNKKITAPTRLQLRQTKKRRKHEETVR